MKKSYLLSPALDMIEFTGDILLERPEEMSQNIIVFPGKRPSHFLRKYLAEKIKMPFVSPQILSIDEFVDFVYTTLLGYIDRMVGPIDAAPIIYSLNKMERLIYNKDTQFYLDEFLPWCFKLFADFEEMCIEEIKPEKLKEIDEIAGEKLPAKIRENLIKLSRLYQLFYEHLQKNNFSTRSLRYYKVGQDIEKADFSIFKRILFVGLFALTKSEKRILSHLALDERIIFIFQKGPGIDVIVNDLKLDVKEVNIENEPPKINFYQAMDVHSEVFKLNQLISNKNNFDFKDVIVLPLADTLFSIVQHTVGFANNEYNISMGYPISRTPVYALIQILSELLETRQGEEYYVPSYFKFVLHPYVKNIYFNQSSYVTRIIFHTIEEHFMDEQRRFATLKEIEENKKIIEECLTKLQNHKHLEIDQEQIKNHLRKIHKILIKPFEDIKDIEDFADKVLNFFSFISENSPANLHPFTAPFIKIVLESIYELKTSNLKNERFKEADSYFRLLKNFLRTVRYPFSGTPIRGLQILGFLETRNIKFDRVYILDVNEGVLPNTQKEDTTLPHSLRAYLGLPTYEAREKIFKYYFETLLAGAKEVHIFYVEGADKEKSRFVEKLFWEQQRRTGKLYIAKNDIFFNVQFSQKEPTAIEKTKEMIQYIKDTVNFTPTRLDRYLKCPLSFYYSEVLKLSAREELGAEPDAMKIGGIAHRILERFFTPKLNQSLTIQEEDFKIMNDIVEEIFNETFPNSSDGSLYLIKMQIKRRMTDTLKYYQNQSFSKRIIMECEGNKNPRFISKRKTLSNCRIKLTNGESVMMVGKLDRVDRDGDSYLIIDYKTGTKPEIPDLEKFDINTREEWLETLKSVQLPSYLIIYLSNNPQITIENINAGLMILGGKEIEEKYLFSDKIPLIEKRNLFDSLSKAVILLIEEILNLSIPFLPTEDIDICANCAFNVMCGRQWVEKSW